MVFLTRFGKMKKKTKALQPVKKEIAVVTTKLDLGCGKNKVAPDFLGVDSIGFPGVDLVCDLSKTWPWKDGSIDEIHCSHMIEHLEPDERIHFVNEMYRVLKIGAKATIIAPHWASCRATGDLTHKWPPISEFWFYYLDAKWREVNAPHNSKYTCHFAIGWGYSMTPELQTRAAEYQQFAFNNYINAAQDIISTWTKAEFPKLS